MKSAFPDVLLLMREIDLSHLIDFVSGLTVLNCVFNIRGLCIVHMNLIIPGRFPSFEFPIIGSGIRPGMQTLILELVNSGSPVTVSSALCMISH